ncbi:hypothetical protein HN446_00100 [bacterium]|jgi:trimeric autotransporter adhesin|nr:hypothetical protein [bacterium]
MKRSSIALFALLALIFSSEFCAKGHKHKYWAYSLPKYNPKISVPKPKKVSPKTALPAQQPIVVPRQIHQQPALPAQQSIVVPRQSRPTGAMRLRPSGPSGGGYVASSPRGTLQPSSQPGLPGGGGYVPTQPKPKPGYGAPTDGSTPGSTTRGRHSGQDTGSDANKLLLYAKKIAQGTGGGVVVKNLDLKGVDVTQLLKDNGYTDPSKNYFAGAVFTKSDFTDATLIGLNLDGVDFSNAILEKTNLTGASLNKAVLNDADVSNAILDGTSLSGTYCNTTNFTGSSFLGVKNLTSVVKNKNTNFSNAVFSSQAVPANFENSTFLSVVPVNEVYSYLSRFDGAIFDYANCHGTKFNGASLKGASFKGANVGQGGTGYSVREYLDTPSLAAVKHTILSAVLNSKTVFTGASFRDSNLSSAGNSVCKIKTVDGDVATGQFARQDLSGADFSEVYAKGATFSNCNFENAELQNSYFRYANFYNANLEAVSVSGTNFSSSRLTRSDNSTVHHVTTFKNVDDTTNFNNANLTNANLTGWDLSHTRNFSNINITGANLTGASLSSPIDQPNIVNGVKQNVTNSVHPIVSATITADTILDNVDLRNANLTGWTIPSDASKRLSANGINLQGTKLFGFNGLYVDFTNAKFDNAYLSHASFYGSKLNGAAFGRVVIDNSHDGGATGFRYSSCAGAKFNNIQMNNPVDFRSATLTDADFSGQDSSHKTKLKANFHGSNFAGALFGGGNASCSVSGCAFGKDGTNITTLDHCDLRNIGIKNATFTGGASLKFVNLENEDLSALNLTGSNMTSANLRNISSLQGANLSNVNLTGADLRNTRNPHPLKVLTLGHGITKGLTGTLFNNVNLTGAQLASWSLNTSHLGSYDIEFNGAIMHGVNLAGAKIADCDFTQANLKSAILRSAYVRYCKLSGADLRGANLYGISGYIYKNSSRLYGSGARVNSSTRSIRNRGCSPGETNYMNNTVKKTVFQYSG